jgi:hypothetical protein
MRLSGQQPRFAVSAPPQKRFAFFEDQSQQARALRLEAERCFRLAQGIASYELAEELEALGRAFEIEAAGLAAAG